MEVIFSQMKIDSNLEPLVFNDNPVKRVDETLHLGLTLDSKLNFESHLKNELAKANSGIGLLIQTKRWVSKPVLETIYKMYTRTIFDYGDIIYHTASLSKNIFFIGNANVLLKKVETIQYKAARIMGHGKGLI